MKVIKVDIKKEFLEIPDRSRVWREVEYPRGTAKLMRIGEEAPPEMITVTETVYEVMQVCEDSKTKELKNYLVKIDDQKMFRELVDISETVVQRRIGEVLEEFRINYLEEKDEIVADTEARLKKLAWWKRLFNKF